MYRKIVIHPALMPYVSSISIQENSAVETPIDAYRVFPSPSPVMGFQYRGKLDLIHDQHKATLSQSGISGLQTSLRWFQPQADTRTVLIQFYPHTIFAFIQHPLHELTNRQVGLEDFLKPNKVKLFQEQLSEANSQADLSVVVQNFLIAQVQSTNIMSTDVVKDATTRILAMRGHVSIEKLAQQYFISRRQLERLFQFYVGVTPKEFASLVRFDWSISNMRNYPSYTELALAAGYADQAHLIRQFVRYAGVSPKQLHKMDAE